MEQEKSGLNEAVGLGTAAVSIAFDVASGNYVRAGVTGIAAFGKYILIILAGILLFVMLIVNMVLIIIGDILGFSTSSEYVREAVAYDRQIIKEKAKDILFDEYEEQNRLAQVLTPVFEDFVRMEQEKYLSDLTYDGYIHEVIPVTETFFDMDYGEWLAGIIVHEADDDLLQRIKTFESNDTKENGQIMDEVLLLLAGREDKHVELDVFLEDTQTVMMLSLYGADVLNSGSKVLLDCVPADGLSKEDVSVYMEKGYVLEEEILPGTIQYYLRPGEVTDVGLNRAYILIQSEQDMELAVTMLKMVAGGGDITDLRQKIFQNISWLSITEESGTGGMGGSTHIITATKEEVVDDWEGISKTRVAICELAISCVGKMEYVWGGYATGPGPEGVGKGLDCSHFIDWVFWTVTGDNLGNVSTMGMGKHMVEISLEEMLPGDLAFTKPPGTKSTKNDANHVLIFVGKDASGERIFVDARSKRSGVCMSTYPEAVYYYRPHCIVNH